MPNWRKDCILYMMIAKNKYELVKERVQRGSSLLDVGCRDCILKKHLKDLNILYKGVDLFQNSESSVDYVQDFSQGLNFISDRSFDNVVALDLLEHIDDFDKSLNEINRIAKSKIIINLPNISHIFFRIRFMFKGQLGNKYELKYEMGQDRHRWVTILSETDKYFTEYCGQKGYELTKLNFVDSKKKLILARLMRLFFIPPSLYVWSTLYIIKK